VKSNNKSLRRQNLVDTHVQGALCKRIFWHWCAFFATTLFAIVGFQVLLGDPGESLSQRLGTQMGHFVLLSILLVSLLPAFMLDTVRFSNRFVGPFARLRRCMRELAQLDNTEELRFRQNDFWNAAALEFNELRRKYVEYKRLCDEHHLTLRSDPVGAEQRD
jgi:hypothetical protein